MEENELGFIDYLSMIWKRKILVIVVTSVCLAIGVAMQLMVPVKYRADVLIKIGKGITTSVPTPLEEPKTLCTTIPVEYGRNLGTGYRISVDTVGATPLIKIKVDGADERQTKEYLKEVVELIVADHCKITEELVGSFRVLASGIGKYFEVVGEETAQFGVSEKKMRVEDSGSTLEVDSDNRFWQKGLNLVSLKRESEYKMYINSLRTNMTKMIGEIEGGAINQMRGKFVMIAGVLGLTVSIFLAMFIEYVNKVSEERKKKA